MKKASRPLDRLAIFSFLWACYMLVQQEFYSNWLLKTSVDGWLLTGAIVAVLAMPRSLFLFTLMVVLGGMERASRLPYAVNHLFIELLMDIAFLLALAAVVWARKKSHRSISWWKALNLSELDAREQFFERIAPVLRLMYVIVYFGAFISKLNYDFFNPALSCGTALYRDLVRTVPILPTGEVVNLFVIWGTMLIELVMPLCFSFRRTWKYGLIIGLSFHIILGLAGHRCFSIQAYAVYFLFLSPAFTEVINDWWPRVRAALGKWTSPLRVGVLILVLALLGLEITGPPALRAMVFFRYNRMLLWLFWSFVVMGIFAAGIYRSSRMPATMPVPRPRLGFLWLMPLLAALNGMTQYLGLKTEHSFTMFSNLRTEAGVNNHFFMPSWLKLTNWDSDVVGIIASDRSDFEYYHDHDLLLTYFEFRRVASELQGDFQVEYMHHGERRRLIVKDGVSNEPEVTHAPPVWMAKLLRFRPISKSTCSECFH